VISKKTTYNLLVIFLGGDGGAILLGFFSWREKSP
jgi:hypothetical protein